MLSYSDGMIYHIYVLQFASYVEAGLLYKVKPLVIFNKVRKPDTNSKKHNILKFEKVIE